MRKLNIHSTVAVITFTIGILTPPISRSPTVQESNPLRKMDQVLVHPQAKTVPSLPCDLSAAQLSDLSIAIQVSGVNPDSPSYELKYIKLAKRGSRIVDLDLAESVDNSEVILTFAVLLYRTECFSVIAPA